MDDIRELQEWAMHAGRDYDRRVRHDRFLHILGALSCYFVKTAPHLSLVLASYPEFQQPPTALEQNS